MLKKGVDVARPVSRYDHLGTIPMQCHMQRDIATCALQGEGGLNVSALLVSKPTFKVFKNRQIIFTSSSRFATPERAIATPLTRVVVDGRCSLFEPRTLSLQSVCQEIGETVVLACCRLRRTRPREFSKEF